MATKKEIEEMLRKSGYSEKAIEYYTDKTNLGKIENPDVESTYMGICGDVMTFTLKVEKNIIKDIKFQATCCAGGLSAGSAATKLVQGKTIDEARKLTEEDIARHLEGCPKQKLHCIVLALKSLKKALDEYSEKQKKNKK